MHFRQQWPRQCDPEVALHDLVQRREIERADVQLATIRGAPQFVHKRALESHAAGEQGTDVLAFESSHGVRERPRRRRVEPLDVVDCDKKVTGARKSSESVEQRNTSRMRIGRRALDVLEDERTRECRALTSGKGRQRLVENRVEKIAETGEAQSSLARRGLRSQDTQRLPPLPSQLRRARASSSPSRPRPREPAPTLRRRCR